MITKREFYINGAWVAPKVARDCPVIDPSTEDALRGDLAGQRGRYRCRRGGSEGGVPGLGGNPSGDTPRSGGAAS